MLDKVMLPEVKMQLFMFRYSALKTKDLNLLPFAMQCFIYYRNTIQLTTIVYCEICLKKIKIHLRIFINTV